MGLAAVAAHKLGGVIPVGAIFRGSIRIGAALKGLKGDTAVRESVGNGLRVLP
jgi:hypothetical protein